MRLGEFFSGPGGLALGAHKAAEDPSVSPHVSLRHEWAFDIDQDSCQTYVENIPGASSTTVHTEDVQRFFDHSEAEKLEPIDGFAFGFPCNDFSIVGEHRGLNGSFGGLYKAGVSVLIAQQPQWFVAENVGGIRSANKGGTFQLILRELQNAGYVIVPHLYKFEEYGVPQARHRVIIVGIRKDLASQGITFRVPKPTHAAPDIAAHSQKEPFVTAKAELTKPYPAGTKHTELPKQSARVTERLSYIKPGQNAFTAAEAMPEHLRLNVKGAHISQIYKKLDPSKPAYTVTGSGGGGTHMYHWAEHRALTNRERARLQTFPDDFNFVGTYSSVRKQIGMAVPVEGAKIIFRALFQSLHSQKYPSIEPNLIFEHQPSLRGFERLLPKKQGSVKPVL